MNERASKKFLHNEFLEDLKKIPPHLHPRQVLFLSADIVGSTILKQSSALKSEDHSAESDLPDGERWFSVIQGFYIEVVKVFEDEWDKAVSKTDRHTDQFYGNRPILWKTIGDEILFRKIISDHRQVNNILKCWISAMSHIRVFLKNVDSKLDIKCTAWLAEFPLQNKQVIGPSGDRVKSISSSNMEAVGELIGEYERAPENFSDTRIDFVGPAIDIGFRLSGKSSSRKFIISLDLAYLISISNRRADRSVLEVHYDGRHYLKGVLGGVEYPMFWIDMSVKGSSDKTEDTLYKREILEWQHIEDFCKSFYEDVSNPSYRPFIITDPAFEYHTPPRNYLSPYGKVIDKYTSEPVPQLIFKEG